MGVALVILEAFMCDEERGEKLLNIIESGIIKHAEQTTNSILGDRTEYIGMSDLGGFITCNRAAILKKISTKTDHTFSSSGSWLFEEDKYRTSSFLRRLLFRCQKKA